jgi:hypothetical protein
VGALILCTFPADRTDLRTWILDRVVVLATRNEAGIKFVGTEQGEGPGSALSTVGVQVASVTRARSVFAEWRSEKSYIRSAEVRLLLMEAAGGSEHAGALFP